MMWISAIAALGLSGSFTNTLGMRMLRIEPGTFRMGESNPTTSAVNAPPRLPEGDWDEKPVHAVTISKPFYIAETEVTIEEYRRFRPDFAGEGEFVTGVSWEDAVAFCEWLSAKEGKPYRLPTEAEWEFACRAGTTTWFSSGDKPPAPGEPNAWGLKNMHTGAGEWCLDWHGMYPAEPQVDPAGPARGVAKVFRGGPAMAPHEFEPYYRRSANRGGVAPGFPPARRDADPKAMHPIGFRVVQAPMPAAKPWPAEVPLAMRDVKQTAPAVARTDPERPHVRKRPLLPVPPDNSTPEAIRAAGLHPAFLHHNHSPALAVCPNGDLLVVYFTASSPSDEYWPNVAFIATRLRYGSDRWDPPCLFFDFPDVAEETALLWNDAGTLWFLTGGVGMHGVPFKWQTSRDNGATWSEVRCPVFEGAIGPHTAQPINSAFRGPDRTIYIPTDGAGGTSVLWASRDEGATWFDTGGRTGGRHTTFVLLRDGSILGLGGKNTNIDGFMPRSLSRDGGKTWQVSRTDFPALGANQRPTLIRLASDRLFFASDFQDFEGRRPKGVDARGAFVALSDDEGATWRMKPLPGAQLHETPRHDSPTIGYAVAAQGIDGIIHLVTSMNHPNLHFELNEAWILSDEDPGAFGSASRGEGPTVIFRQSADAVDVYDFVEVTMVVARPAAANPFTDVSVEGIFARGADPHNRVDGFCDSQDGKIFRIRFMPSRAGEHRYSVTYRQGAFEARHEGRFTARDGGRRGPVRADPKHPWHFIWEGTGEHYFWNGTTTYWLMGWDDETIRKALDRLHRLKVNRVRVVIDGRVKDGRAWFENVYPTERFTFLLNPWLAARPESVEDPGFDVSRFNVAHWQKYERLLAHARGLDMVVSAIFYVDGRRPGVDPFGKEGMGGEDERRYYRYAAARFASFSNVMWDVTNEYHLFRDEAWTDRMGAFLKECDPYDHLASVHGHGEFPFRTSPWADFAMHQQWDEGGGYRFLRACRDKQAKTGRPMPQVNEEYGYEDHYPTWGGNRKAPARSADNRRRLAWGMYMAGGYQTTGERADTGTGWGPDTGGGWINGRGDDSMVMLEGYGRIVDFFTEIPWWTLEPDDDLIEVRDESPVRMSLTHIVYARERDGRATLYVDGKPVAAAVVGGDVSNWDGGFRLALANELTRDRPWLGEYRRIALYDRSLGAEEVRRRFEAGLAQAPVDPLVLYTFEEGEGNIVNDVSGKGEPLDLAIEKADAVTWIESGGLRIRAPVLMASAEPAKKVTEAVRRSGAFALEAWVAPANATQAGPARLVTLSKDTGNRNVTLGQAARAYEVRFRTSETSPNGEPSLWSPGRGASGVPIFASRSPAGDLAVVYFERGGEVTLDSSRLVEGLEARWYDPRSGGWWPAPAGGDKTYRTPDAEDWVLLLRRP